MEEAEVGKVYDGKVVNIVDFGAFVNFMGGKDGLVHVSEMRNERVEKPTDVVSEGQAVKVKVLEIDQRGKVRLSRAPAAVTAATAMAAATNPITCRPSSRKTDRPKDRTKGRGSSLLRPFLLLSVQSTWLTREQTTNPDRLARTCLPARSRPGSDRRQD